MYAAKLRFAHTEYDALGSAWNQQPSASPEFLHNFRSCLFQGLKKNICSIQLDWCHLQVEFSVKITVPVFVTCQISV
jgi:hypothetical protein